ncbi:helix-turn-helix domain-containing protein [Streptosporangium vulgare]|uniref:Helix-turn-helix domain-containing protein n=1 Tax=Streptosporangium vulgare TaxID=46190 RepID=A0ABV5TM34_9ACTN
MAKFQRQQIVKGIREGFDAARARGCVGGRPRSLTPEQIDDARILLAAGKAQISVAKGLGVSRWTPRRALENSPGPALAEPSHVEITDYQELLWGSSQDPSGGPARMSLRTCSDKPRSPYAVKRRRSARRATRAERVRRSRAVRMMKAAPTEA